VVTSGHVDKDGGHTNRSALAKNPILHGCVFYRNGVIADQSWILRK